MTETTYTPAQKALIEKHRDWNVEDHWWGGVYESFREVAKAFGFDLDDGDINFSGFCSQGDGAKFSLSRTRCLDVIEATHKTLDSGEYGDPAKFEGVLKAFHDAYLTIATVFEPFALITPEGREYADAVSFVINSRGSYEHSGYMELEVEFDEIDCVKFDDLNEGQRAVIEAIEAKLLTDGRTAYDFTRELQRELRLCADALYADLEREHEYQSSDGAVWDALVANHDDEELAEMLAEHEDDDNG